MGGAWLCDRCTGLYIGGGLGVVHAHLLTRATSLRVQLLVFVALQIPVAIDKLVLGIDSPLDVTAVRIATGTLGGFGLGLLLGTRAVGRVRWPPPLGELELARWSWLALIVAIALFTAGVHLPLNLAVLLGLVALCFAGTAWAFAWIARGARRLRRRPSAEDGPKLSPTLLLLTVIAELFIVAITPGQYKPHLGWLWEALSWFGLGPQA